MILFLYFFFFFFSFISSIIFIFFWFEKVSCYKKRCICLLKNKGKFNLIWLNHLTFLFFDFGWLLSNNLLMLNWLRQWLGAYRIYRYLLIWTILCIVSSSTIRSILSIIFNNFINRFALWYKHFCQLWYQLFIIRI
jgi:hypothetical protein